MIERFTYLVELRVYNMVPQEEFLYDVREILTNGVLTRGRHQYYAVFTEDEMEAFAEYVATQSDIKLIGITNLTPVENETKR